MQFGKLLSTLLSIGTSFDNEGALPPNIGDIMDVVTFDVCLSPGCMADGAAATIVKLRALAPPNIVVRKGSCSSACGNGPIVIRKSLATKGETGQTYRKITGDKILQLLSNEGEDAANANSRIKAFTIDERLAQGYDLTVLADHAFSLHNYELSRDLYAQAIDLALQPASSLQAQRDGYHESMIFALPSSSLPRDERQTSSINKNGI